ncbi:hypothetical protein J6590_048337 [Homalodisca vitripennis]|nr:hypothetical protein J6590_048337 [Homalodisca vitripennis]
MGKVHAAKFVLLVRASCCQSVLRLRVVSPPASARVHTHRAEEVRRCSRRTQWVHSCSTAKRSSLGYGYRRGEGGCTDVFELHCLAKPLTPLWSAPAPVFATETLTYPTSRTSSRRGAHGLGKKFCVAADRLLCGLSQIYVRRRMLCGPLAEPLAHYSTSDIRVYCPRKLTNEPRPSNGNIPDLTLDIRGDRDSGQLERAVTPARSLGPFHQKPKDEMPPLDQKEDIHQCSTPYGLVTRAVLQIDGQTIWLGWKKKHHNSFTIWFRSPDGHVDMAIALCSTIEIVLYRLSSLFCSIRSSHSRIMLTVILCYMFLMREPQVEVNILDTFHKLVSTPHIPELVIEEYFSLPKPNSSDRKTEIPATKHLKRTDRGKPLLQGGSIRERDDESIGHYRESVSVSNVRWSIRAGDRAAKSHHRGVEHVAARRGPLGEIWMIQMLWSVMLMCTRFFLYPSSQLKKFV